MAKYVISSIKPVMNVPVWTNDSNEISVHRLSCAFSDPVYISSFEYSGMPGKHFFTFRKENAKTFVNIDAAISFLLDIAKELPFEMAVKILFDDGEEKEC